jgi:hypothetical protein
MKVLFFILSLSSVVGIASAQDAYVKYLPSYYDEKAVTHYKGTLKRTDLSSPFVIYITSIDNKQVTYVIWFKSKVMSVVQITDSTISKPLTTRQHHFMAALNLEKLAVRESENQLKFKPPLICPSSGSGAAFIEISRKEYVIEYGRNCNYVLDKKKNTSRAAFFRVLAQDLEPFKGKWQVATPYKRY